MAKTKLLVSTKDDLRRFARNNISTPKETKAVKIQYTKIVKQLHPIIAKKYPAEDMEILAKYDKTTNDTCVRVAFESQVTGFNFEKEDAVIVPSGYCHNRCYAVTKTLYNMIEDWKLKKDQVKDAKENILREYKAVIQAARNAEDLMEIWPASKTILEPFIASQATNSNLPVAVSEDTIKFIRKNNAGKSD